MSQEKVVTYCAVAECRHPESHVTAGHKCGNCKCHGHGQIECHNPIKKIQLKDKLNDILPENLQCKFGSCKYKQLHTSEAHQCSKCQELLHSASTCPLNLNLIQKIDLEIKCPLCKQDNKVPNDQQKIFSLTDICIVCLENNVEVFFPNCGHVCVCMICFKKLIKQDEINMFDDIRNEHILSQQHYQLDKIKTLLPDYPCYIIIYEPMGCCTIIRRLNIKSPVEGLFNHSDDSYTPAKVNKLKEFIDGYCLITNKIHDFLIHEWR